MKKPQSFRLVPARHKRAVIIVCALLVLALVAYAEVIRPTQSAKSYVSKLDSSSQPLKSCFESLAGSTQLKIYYAPDVPIVEKRKDATTILSRIDTCRNQLQSFDGTAHDLMDMHLTGYTPTYKQAKVYQRQAYDLVGQSRDVLDQYDGLATFLNNYYGHMLAFETYTNDLQTNKYYLGSAQLAVMKQQAADLRQRAAAIRKLDSPQEFNSTKSATAEMFENCATGFENVVSGYRGGNDYTVERGYKQIDATVATYDATVMNLPFQHLINSYIPKQVNQLPSKVENLLSSSSE